jgi:hypothetical protein
VLALIGQAGGVKKRKGGEKRNYTQRKRFHEKKSNTERLNRDLLLCWRFIIKVQVGRGRQANAKLCQHPKLTTTLTAKMCTKSIPNWYSNGCQPIKFMTTICRIM